MTEQTYRDHLNSLQVEIEELRAKLKASQAGDLISRQAAINAISEHLDGVLGQTKYDEGIAYGYEAAHRHIQEVIAHMPSAQPGRKKGHYIGEADGYADGELVYDIWSCSECGCYFEDWDEQPTYNFCPNCGADMRGDNHETT